MKVLALEPYYGGSHRAFLDGWRVRSRHEWTVLSLPDTKWKWRMRHAAITFAGEAEKLAAGGAEWDAVYCSDMLNLAEFMGLAPTVQSLPALLYFHENQLTYPVEREEERDYQFAFTNLTSGLAATRVWFNSAYHRDSFLDALPLFLKRMPDHQPFDAPDLIRAKSEVHPQGVDAFPPRVGRSPGPIRLLWAARWEYDKDPTTFFRALRVLVDKGVCFEVSVVGGGDARRVPPIFAEAKGWLGDRVRDWGYLPDRGQYERVLREADVVVSTAVHEFFGISVVEAVSAGCYPMVPRRLAYPEVLQHQGEDGDAFLYEGGASSLASRLEELANRVASGDLWQGRPRRGVNMVKRYTWEHVVPRWDDALERLNQLSPQPTTKATANENGK